MMKTGLFGGLTLVAAQILMDRQGYDLYDYWLKGKGRAVILESKEWQEYMRAHDILAETLTRNIIYRMALDNPTRSQAFSYRFDVELPDNGFFTGYELLHAADYDKKGDELHGVYVIGQLSVTKNKNGTVTAKFEKTKFLWVDRLDPNLKYSSDRFYSKLVGPANGTDYDVTIIWTDGGKPGKLTWCPSDGAMKRQKQMTAKSKGYPFDGGNGGGRKGLISVFHPRRLSPTKADKTKPAPLAPLPPYRIPY